MLGLRRATDLKYSSGGNQKLSGVAEGEKSTGLYGERKKFAGLVKKVF
jgi:hypothetical protein